MKEAAEKTEPARCAKAKRKPQTNTRRTQTIATPNNNTPTPEKQNNNQQHQCNIPTTNANNHHRQQSSSSTTTPPGTSTPSCASASTAASPSSGTCWRRGSSPTASGRTTSCGSCRSRGCTTCTATRWGDDYCTGFISNIMEGAGLTQLSKKKTYRPNLTPTHQ